MVIKSLGHLRKSYKLIESKYLHSEKLHFQGIFFAFFQIEESLIQLY